LGHKKSTPTLDVRSLRQQVYEYIRDEMQNGKISPGSYIKLKKISKQLGISTTPLRDAIIQLECEGFVTILPRRGVLVKRMTPMEIREYFQIIGSLESSVVFSEFNRIGSSQINKMQALNLKMKESMLRKDVQSYFRMDMELHGILLKLSNSTTLHNIIMPLKQRLFEFSTQKLIPEWASAIYYEHSEFIQHLRNADRQAAISVWRHKHWSFSHHRKNIQTLYTDTTVSDAT